LTGNVFMRLFVPWCLGDVANIFAFNTSCEFLPTAVPGVSSHCQTVAKGRS
jgi:hypothetical protein